MRAKASLIFWAAGGIFLTTASCLDLPLKLVWNRTESVPKGLYFVASKGPLERGDLVAFRADVEDRKWLERRGYIGLDWPLLKLVSALERDTVCRNNLTVSVNGFVVAEALERDGFGRELPSWQGCHTLEEDEIFLIAPHPRSLDGRYFGVQRTKGVLGIAHPIGIWNPIKHEIALQAIWGGRAPVESAVSQRARLKSCPMGTPKSLSAHLFLGDTGSEERCTDLWICGGVE